MASTSWESEPAVADERRLWKSRVLIGAIIGSEAGVFLALVSTLFQGETDPWQFTCRLAILFVALLAMSILRRKALPTESES